MYMSLPSGLTCLLLEPGNHSTEVLKKCTRNFQISLPRKWFKVLRNSEAWPLLALWLAKKAVMHIAYITVPLELCRVGMLPVILSCCESCVALSRFCTFCLTQCTHLYSGNHSLYRYESNLFLSQQLVHLFKFWFWDPLWTQNWVCLFGMLHQVPHIGIFIYKLSKLFSHHLGD